MNRARAVMAAVAAAIGTTVAAGVLVVGGGGSAAGSTIPVTKIPGAVYQTPTPVVMIPLPTAVLDHWQCDEISCRPVQVYFGQ